MERLAALGFTVQESYHYGSTISFSQIPLPTINSQVVRTLLQYLYTGQCLFPRDDLNLGLDLLATADRFLLEPMRLQTERALSEKIDAEVCVCS